MTIGAFFHSVEDIDATLKRFEESFLDSSLA